MFRASLHAVYIGRAEQKHSIICMVSILSANTRSTRPRVLERAGLLADAPGKH